MMDSLGVLGFPALFFWNMNYFLGAGIVSRAILICLELFGPGIISRTQSKN